VAGLDKGVSSTETLRENGSRCWVSKKGEVKHRAQSNSLAEKINIEQQIIETSILILLFSCVSTIYLLLYLVICEEGIFSITTKL